MHFPAGKCPFLLAKIALFEGTLQEAAGNFRDAKMTIKIMSERSSQKGGRQGVRKEGQQGTQLEILLSAKSTGQTAFWKKSHFNCCRLFPGDTATISWTIAPLPPSRGSGRKNPRELLSKRILVISALPKIAGGFHGSRIEKASILSQERSIFKFRIVSQASHPLCAATPLANYIP